MHLTLLVLNFVAPDFILANFVAAAAIAAIDITVDRVLNQSIVATLLSALVYIGVNPASAGGHSRGILKLWEWSGSTR